VIRQPGSSAIRILAKVWAIAGPDLDVRYKTLFSEPFGATGHPNGLMLRLPQHNEKISGDTVDYKPGDVVPHTGIYSTHHSSHRLMHEATLEKGTRFPRCKRCHDAVRFTLRRRLQVANVAPVLETEFLISDPESLKEAEPEPSSPFIWKPGMPDRRKNGSRNR
jgi:hypothetical protein